jgi:hypothetical protein
MLTIAVGARESSAPSSIREEDWVENPEHDRLLSEFNRQRPVVGYQSRISSWSDPMSAREIFDGEDPRSRRKIKPSQLGRVAFGEEILSSENPSTVVSPAEEVDGFKWRLWEDGRMR